MRSVFKRVAADRYRPVVGRFSDHAVCPGFNKSDRGASLGVRGEYTLTRA